MATFRVRAMIEMVIQARDYKDANTCAEALLTRRVEGQSWGAYKDFQGEVVDTTILDEWEEIKPPKRGDHDDRIKDGLVKGSGA